MKVFIGPYHRVSLILFFFTAVVVGFINCQRIQGDSQHVAWSPSGQRNNQVYQSRELTSSSQQNQHYHHQQQQQQQQQQASEPIEYYDEEYYEDEVAPAAGAESLFKDEPTREAKASKTDKTSANSSTIYEDTYYYDEDYEDETVPAKPNEPSTTTTTTTTTTTSENPPIREVTPTSTIRKDDNEEHEETTKTISTSSSSTTTTTTEKVNEESILIGEAIVSVVTTKSVVNGTYSVPDLTTVPTIEPTKQMSSETSSTTTPSTTTTTDGTTSTTSTTEAAPSSTTIHASVQTGRSVSGARFLPFPSVVDKAEQLDSTESIIDKLDRVQSELSSGFLSNSRFVPRRYNKKPFSVASLILPTTSTTLAPTASPIAPVTITSITKRPKIQTTLDDVAAFLPKDFPKSSLYRTSTTTTTTTIAPPSTKRPKIQTTLDDIEAFLPKDFPKSSYRTSTTKRPKFQTTLDDVDAFLPKDYHKGGGYRSGSFKRPNSYKTSTTLSSSTTTTTKVVPTSTEKSTASTRPKTLTTIEDIAAFLPPGYKLKKEDATTEKSVLLSEILAKASSIKPKEGSTLSPSTTERAKSIQDLFAKSSLDISPLLPPGYKPPEVSSPKPISTEKSAGSDLIQELFAKSSVDISALLPPGFKPDTTETESKVETSTSSSTTSTEKTNGGSFKLVFPSRPGGGTRKPIHKITTQSSRAIANAAASEPAIKKGWPVRATTEFTGWPTSSTTPISIEKLLEAARTATVSSLNISLIPTTEEITSTSSTTTTTTTTMRPTTPGICVDECEVAGTIKIVENAVWVPELLDRNTKEWQDLAEEIEREMNLVFAKSLVLRKWFRNIRIDSFSQGSVLVDYFVELNDLKEKVNTQQLKVIFHETLRNINAVNPDEATPKGPMKLGKFTIDPKSTDFVVIPRVAAPKMLEDENRLIPQWAIAVIVIGVGGLLFIIVFGVSVLVNRQHGSKLKPSISAMYDEEVMSKNAMSHHAAPIATPSRPPAADYHKHHDSQAMWNDSGWHDKPFESTSHKILVDGLPYERKYNMYDSWKSEWNGYFQPPTQASGSNFSRHYPDYDINF